MSNESLLKKEFKHSDVQRVRNIVNKDFTAKTKSQVGYQKTYQSHSEGDVWEESGKQWTIKNGIKQNITKLDTAKKATRLPLRCPKCGGPMKHWLAKKMYYIHGFCFDPCTVEFEASLQKAGLYEAYEKKMMSGNISNFIKDIEAWVFESLGSSNSVVTEDGVVEDWGGMSNSYKDKIIEDLKGYVELLKSHI
jgi:predicted nucleic-acid-binding Zn-ribbon protein